MPRITRRHGPTATGDLLAKAGQSAFTMHVTTDPHIWSAVGEDPNAPGAISGNKHFYRVPSKLRDFVAQTNAAQPHLAICLGDILESGGDFAYFNDIWDDLTVPSEVIPGNHDYSLPFTTTRQQAAADGLGFGDAPVVGGSRMTRSVVHEGNGVQVRFLFIDVNVNRDASPAEPNGHLTPEAKTWIADELAASPQDIIFIVTHHGPHNFNSGWFVAADAADLQAIVETELSARPHRTIRGLFGHRHAIGAGLTEYRNMGRFIGLNAPVLLEGEWSRYTRIHVTADGQIAWDYGYVKYTPA